MQKKPQKKPGAGATSEEQLEKIKATLLSALEQVDTSQFGKVIPKKIIPPVYFFAALIVMATLDYFAPMSQLIFVPLRVFGGLLVLGGLAVTTAAACAFWKANTPIRPFEKSTTLVTDGLYQYSRNPMYLGMLIMLTGTWIALGSFSPVLVIPVFFLIIQEGFIKYEEPFLQAIFGDEYLDYKARVYRWIGWSQEDKDS